MANGDATALFKKYQDAVDSSSPKIALDWAGLTVIFVDAATGRQETLVGQKPSFGEALAGVTTVGKWKKRLKGRAAAARPDPAADARGAHADLVCGS